ncbi:unnamed protein product [Toxocara canis]|uniref:C-type lectin domain-containing protein n=1 Tax=Toxocara canis TaxID=6265 RepID=A0A183TVR1_TOXCA|nr:unnamed protein product [Toxocara canis]
MRYSRRRVGANCYCLQPYVQFTDQCTEYGECIYQHGQPLDYFTAQETCANYNAVMIDVLSEQKDLFIRNMQQQLSYTPYWIGVQYTSTGYMWNSGIKISTNDYTNWASGQPNITNGDCVYEMVQGANGTWYSDMCGYVMPAHYFLCQKKSCEI